MDVLLWTLWAAIVACYSLITWMLWSFGIGWLQVGIAAVGAWLVLTAVLTLIKLRRR